MADLTSQGVRDLFEDCRFKPGIDEPKLQLEVPGVLRSTFLLHRGKLEGWRGLIDELLYELPYGFRQGYGGGRPMSKMGIDYRGYKWTTEEAVMERLVVLGYATGRIRFLVPRASWAPGESPVVVVML